MSARRSTVSSTGKSRAGITLGVVTAVGAVGGIAGIFGSGTAVADPVSLTLKYTCTFPLINQQPLVVKLNSDIPTSIGVGESTPKFAIDAVATVNAATTQGLSLVSAKTLEGSVDAKASVLVPQGNIDVTVPIDMAKTSVPASGTFDVKATGTAPALTFSQPGNGKITVGDLVLHLAPKDANGNLTGLGKFDAPCKLDAGQNNVLASFAITGTGTSGSTTSGTTGTTGSTTSGTTGSTTSGTTGSTTSGTTGATTSGTTGTTTDGTTGSTTSGTTGTAGTTGTTGTTGATTDGSTGSTGTTTAGTTGTDTSGGTGTSGSTDYGTTSTTGSTGSTGSTDYGGTGQTIGTQVGDTTGGGSGGSLAATGGPDTEGLVLLAAGVLTAGMAAFRFGSRLTHRRPGGDR